MSSASNAKVESVVFTNDGDVEILYDLSAVPGHVHTDVFPYRNNFEVSFRRMCTFLIDNGLVRGAIVDSGAWIGDNAVPWGARLKQKGRDYKVYAIDPSPDNCTWMKRLVELNNLPNVKILQVALSDKEEELATDGDLRHCSFVNGDGATRVRAITLDRLMHMGALERVSFMHLDVEGMEARVLAGASALIDAWSPMIAFEQHLHTDQVSALAKWLQTKGYTVFIMNEPLIGCQPDCRNFFAVPSFMSALADHINLYLGSPILMEVLKVP